MEPPRIWNSQDAASGPLGVLGAELAFVFPAAFFGGAFAFPRGGGASPSAFAFDQPFGGAFAVSIGFLLKAIHVQGVTAEERFGLFLNGCRRLFLTIKASPTAVDHP